MIVFPLIRAVGLKAATASSRDETLPMFARSRPARTRWTISLSWGTIGLDDEVDHQAAGGPRLGRPDDGHQRSSGSSQACGPLPDVAADDIEHQIDWAQIQPTTCSMAIEVFAYSSECICDSREIPHGPIHAHASACVALRNTSSTSSAAALIQHNTALGSQTICRRDSIGTTTVRAGTRCLIDRGQS